MELIIEYLITKGGGFGVLLAIALAWIVFREKNLLSQKESKQEKEETPAKDPDIAKILFLIEEFKAETEKGISQVASIHPILEQLVSLEKTGNTKLEKVNSHITVVENKAAEIERKVKDLWDWHSMKDGDGIFLWYNKRSTEESIQRLKAAVEELDKNFMQITKSICMDLDERLQKVNDERVSELKKLLETYNKTVTDLILALEKIKFLLKSKEDGE
jgi:DNA repair ATPase RecN